MNKITISSEDEKKAAMFARLPELCRILRMYPFSPTYGRNVPEVLRNQRGNLEMADIIYLLICY